MKKYSFITLTLLLTLLNACQPDSADNIQVDSTINEAYEPFKVTSLAEDKMLREIKMEILSSQKGRVDSDFFNQFNFDVALKINDSTNQRSYYSMLSSDSIQLDESGLLYYDNLVMTYLDNEPRGFVVRNYYPISERHSIHDPIKMIVFTPEMDTIISRTKSSTNFGGRTTGVSDCSLTLSYACVGGHEDYMRCDPFVSGTCWSSSSGNYSATPNSGSRCERDFFGNCVYESSGGGNPTRNPGSVSPGGNQLEKEIMKNLELMAVLTEVQQYGYKVTKAEQKLIDQNPIQATSMFISFKDAWNTTVTYFGENTSNDCSDAFRHAIWNALATQRVGESFTKKFTDAHESEVPTGERLAKEMDLFNNTVGQSIGNKYPNHNHPIQLASIIRDQYLYRGKLKMFSNPKSFSSSLITTSSCK